MEKDRDQSLNITPLNPNDSRQIAVAIQGTMGGGSSKKGNNESDSPPKVIASGYGKLAEQILAMAFKKGIKVRADADLAQLLATLDLDTPIPSEAIVAVAEILSRVYEANARHGTPEPEGRTL